VLVTNQKKIRSIRYKEQAYFFIKKKEFNDQTIHKTFEKKKIKEVI